MAFDGITTANIVKELNDTLSGGGISRIIQPEKDELLITVKNRREQYLLLLSASASLPLLYLTDQKKEAPASAPNFCMLLRKHLQGGRIQSVTQPSLERIVVFSVLHRDELGDLREKRLIFELMGKYSNIIFTDDRDTILDSIRRVPSTVSSLREVLPGRTYFLPESLRKEDPLRADADTFSEKMSGAAGSLAQALVGTWAGISPAAAEEYLFRAELDARKGWADLSGPERDRLAETFLASMEEIRSGIFYPCIIREGDIPREFGSLRFRMYEHEPFTAEQCGSASEMIVQYWGAKEKVSRMRQKSADLRHAAQVALDRTCKKAAIQEKQMKSTEKRDKYRIYGEMLNTYGYSVPEGAKELTCTNYYTDEPVTVPLDPSLSPSENAQKYFARYNKLKRTAEAVAVQLAETESDREQLEAILTAVSQAESESDLREIRREMADFGFISRRGEKKKGARKEAKSAPYAYRSSDGFEILVGKNNYQNEELSFKISSPSDWWFHAKGLPGSHVIVRSRGQEVPDRTFEEAGALAAYYSASRGAPKVEIDYTLRRNLRKKNGGKPGFVIYHTNYSLMASPDISGLERLS